MKQTKNKARNIFNTKSTYYEVIYNLWADYLFVSKMFKTIGRRKWDQLSIYKRKINKLTQKNKMKFDSKKRQVFL